jgi:hypothetical protein
MQQNSEEEQGALKLAEIIENTVKDPQKAAERMEEKIKSKSVLGTIFDFIKDYKNKDPNQSNEEWAKQQFAKQEEWQAAKTEKEQIAKNIMQDIEDYDNAKKSLALHIEQGGTRASWLAEQIEKGAANNNKNLAEYAKEVSAGLHEAMEENKNFLIQTKEAT